ncbi:hypothetical protein [Agromyces silvae]|uniref:hypothetical protein n=1 Tax=Agromyces silvae TaxID=3388266 RepID=UPI00280B31DA|nr:hypothetical protein [Agromyces protaetiae]
MLQSLLIGTIVASTLAGPTSLADTPSTHESPAASSAPATAAETTKTIPLVGETLGIGFTVVVNQDCPEGYWVHRDGWVGALPELVTFGALYTVERRGAKTNVSGLMTNGSIWPKQVSIGLKCTTDLAQAKKTIFHGMD